MEFRWGAIIVATAVAATWIVGSLSAVSAGADYGALEQPAWAPPSWLFGPVWTALYIGIAVAGVLAYRQLQTFNHPMMHLFFAQLAINALWTPLFFAWELRGLALAWIVTLDFLVAFIGWKLLKVNRISGGLFAPYLLWIMFATALNASVWTLNR
jgi:benzodiazapine receptor